MIRTLKIAGALAVGLGTAMPASAALVVCANQGCSGTTTNAMFNNGDTGTKITGLVGTTKVYFNNDDDLIMKAQASGQAALTGENGGPLLGTITITLDNATFTSFEFNLPGIPGNPPPAEASSVTFNIVDGAGNAYSVASPYPTYSLDGGGQNWFSGHTTDGDVIKSITLTLNPTDAGVDALKQPRFGGIAPAVPEPATWGMLIVGFGLIGAAMRRRAAKPAVTLA